MKTDFAEWVLGQLNCNEVEVGDTLLFCRKHIQSKGGQHRMPRDTVGYVLCPICGENMNFVKITTQQDIDYLQRIST